MPARHGLRPSDERELRRKLLEYQAILDNASLGITLTRQGSFLHCNQRFSEMFGWHSDELIRLPTDTLYPSLQAYKDFVQLASQVLGGGRRLDTEVLMKRRDGSLFWCRLLAKAIDPADYSTGVIYLAEDISERRAAQDALQRAHAELEQRVAARTAELALANARLQAEIQERKLAEQQIRYLANHDALTGLPNRRLLEDRLEQAIELARRHGHQVAVQCIDLDHFKPVNDRLGHHVGDLLLQALAQRLRSLLRAADTVARVGGDEFVVVLPEIHSATAAAETAQKVLAALAQPYVIEGQALTVTPSIGISLYPQHGSAPDALLRCADAAMYAAKRSGRAGWRLSDASDSG